MARFLVSTLGSAGDVHPFVAISQTLLSRGHEVRLIASPYFEDRIQRAGVPFSPIGAPGDYERVLRRPELWQPRGGARFILHELLQRLPEAYATTEALARAPGTVLVGSTLSWGLRLVQEQVGLRAATVHLSPVCVQSAFAPPILPGVGDLSWMPVQALQALQWAVERLLLDRWMAPRLNAFRRTLGLAPVQRIWSRWMHSPDLVIGAWPAWFSPPQPDWPSQAQTSGFPLFDDGGSGLDRSLMAFLDAGAPPIGITPGSAMAHGTRFFARALDACRALGQRVVLVTPYRDQLPEPLPAWAHHAAYAPFGALLPRLSALVHHGGIGTSAQALAAGIPQLVVPFAHDQFDNAARLRRLGVSRTLDAEASQAAWVAALQGLAEASNLSNASKLSNTRVALKAAAGRMAAGEPAVLQIARRLEALAT